MYKFLLFLVLLLLPMPTLAAEQLEIKANTDGKVTLDKDLAPDAKQYELNNAAQDDLYLVPLSTPVMFTTNDYRNGFFNNPTTNFTINVRSGSAACKYGTSRNTDFSIGYPECPFLSDTPSATWIGADIIFDDVLEINGMYVSEKNGDIKFLDSANNVLYTKPTNLNGYIDLELNNVKKIDILTYNHIGNLEIFVKYDINYIAIKNLHVATKDKQATISWVNPDTTYFKHNAILLDNNVVVSNTTSTNAVLTDLEPNKKYDLTVRSYYVDGKYIDVNTTFTTKRDTTPPAEVTNLTAKQTNDNITLTWTNPTDKDFRHVKIMRDGQVIADNVTATEFMDSAAKINAINNYKVQTIDNNSNISAGKNIQIHVSGKNITNLKATATDYTNVELTWHNPTRTDFNKATIYRQTTQNLMQRVANLANEPVYTPLFETDGTTFKDLTVAPDTAYTYKVTSTVAGEETDGLITKVKTPKIAPLGSTVTPPTSENEPYVIKWTAPNTGSMLVRVGGIDYKTVPASDLQVTIPKSDMRYDFLNNPDVQLVPLDDAGAVIGEPSKPATPNGVGGGIQMPETISADKVLTSGVALFGVVSLFVLLGLAFRVVPKLIQTIKTAWGR